MVTSTSNGEVAATVEGQALDSAKGRGASPEDLRLALRAATLYYLDGLTQAEIAGRLGVSRPTVREALTVLVAEGLATRQPNRGVTVAFQRVSEPTAGE